jgi:hypothetical protein
MRLAAALMLSGMAVTAARAAELKPETVRDFDRYIHNTEARLEERLRPGGEFLWVDEESQRGRAVRQGQLLIENLGGSGPVAVTGGLIHDWVGAVFIPGVTLARTLALMQDYDRNQDNYKPEVLRSRLVSGQGNDFKVYLRLMKHEVITVILDTEYDVRYFPLDSTRCRSRAYSSRIQEVENAGKPDERLRPVGEDNGYLWRLYSYWRFQERDGGVYVECEATSLTRAIPVGLGWLIAPIVTKLPRQSLANTLRETRAALAR